MESTTSKHKYVEYQPDLGDKFDREEFAEIKVKGNTVKIGPIKEIYWDRSPFPCLITHDNTIYIPYPIDQLWRFNP